AARTGVLLHGLHEPGDRFPDRADPGALALVVGGTGNHQEILSEPSQSIHSPCHLPPRPQSLRPIRQCSCPETRVHPAYKYSPLDCLFQTNSASLPAVNLPVALHPSTMIRTIRQ